MKDLAQKIFVGNNKQHSMMIKVDETSFNQYVIVYTTNQPTENHRKKNHRKKN